MTRLPDDFAFVPSEFSRRQWLSGAATSVVGGTALGALAASQATASEPKGRKIKIGQIGVGHAHASKLGVYRELPDYEVVGIVEPDPVLREHAANQAAYRGLPWMTQEQLLNVPGLEAVMVETGVAGLLDAAEACISAGKHIHLDKPAGASLPHFRRIVASAEKQKLIIQMGYMWRYNPAIVMLRDFLKRGWLGEVFEVHAVMSKVVAPDTRRELAEFPGGIMFELGCHVIDLVVGILGKPTRVTPYTQHAARHDDQLVDNMLAVFEYPRAIASVKSSAMEVEGFERRHLVVCGSEGTFHIQPLDNPAARVALSRPRGELKAGYQDVTYPKYSRYIDDARDFARVLRGEAEFGFSYQHDLDVQTTLLEACGVSTET